MSKRRLIYYDDARHYHMYVYEPPMRLEHCYAPVDQVAGTGVDTFAWGLGLGPTFFYDTKAGDIFASHLEKIGDPASWRAYENVVSLIDRGLDPMKIIVDRAHEQGMEFIGSFRMAHSSDPKDVENAHNWRFKIDHPAWVLKGDDSDPGRKNSFNWVHPEVRAERFAIIEEVVTGYDIDGFELDLSFGPYYFEADEVAQNMHILTDFVRDVRRLADDVGQERGRPIDLGARLHPSLQANLDSGFDVETWFGEGLLDFAVPNVYGHVPIDGDFPFEWLIELACPNGCEVYPAMGSVLGANREAFAGVDYYRAAAAAYWSRGADGLYLPWFHWPVDSEARQILTEIPDRDVLAEKPRRYYMAPRQEQSVKFGYDAQLPLDLELGRKAPGQTVSLYVAENARRADMTLRLKLAESTSHDSMTVTLNGNALPHTSSRYTSHGYSYSWLEYPLKSGSLPEGPNEIGVALHSRPSNLTSTVVLEGLEIAVEYPRAEAPA